MEVVYICQTPVCISSDCCFLICLLFQVLALLGFAEHHYLELPASHLHMRSQPLNRLFGTPGVSVSISRLRGGLGTSGARLQMPEPCWLHLVTCSLDYWNEWGSVRGTTSRYDVKIVKGNLPLYYVNSLRVFIGWCGSNE